MAENVDCRIGSLEIESLDVLCILKVDCRIGSLENIHRKQKNEP